MTSRIRQRPGEKSAANKKIYQMISSRMRAARLGGLAIGACLLVLASLPTAASAIPSNHPFEIIPGSFHITPSTKQAGAHEDLDYALRLRPQRRRSDLQRREDHRRQPSPRLPR